MIARVELVPVWADRSGRDPRSAIDFDRQVATLRGEFPSVELVLASAARKGRSIRIDEWEDPSFDFYRFDDAIDELSAQGDAALAISGPCNGLVRGALEVMTRCQRCIMRTNQGSATAFFRRLLVSHREIHDIQKPLVLADFRHALDTWQWVLRLSAEASPAVQLAALFHDVERLFSEGDVRVEHHAADYQVFKDAHAKRGSELARSLLSSVGTEPTLVEAVIALIEHHERPGEDAALALLNDADALSFFSLNSGGYLDYFGAAQTQRKVRYTLGRIRPSNLWRLETVRLRPEIRELYEREIAA
jgi:hypothetical protein